eukprot:1100035-Rhodomonas_salina.1
MEARRRYAFGFEVRNPDASQLSPPIVISASSAAVALAESRISKPDGPLLGVTGGANPMRVVVPEFVIRNVVQSTPLANENNVITVSLQTNVELSLSDDSIVTIAGFEGSFENSTIALIVAGVLPQNYPFCDLNGRPGRASWDPTVKSLVFRVCGDAVQVGM